EIERKFLIKRLPIQILHSRHFPLRQGYLANETRGRHVRLRKKGKTMSLTFKASRGREPSREEHEIRLSEKQFATLWPATKGRRHATTDSMPPARHRLWKVSATRRSIRQSFR